MSISGWLTMKSSPRHRFLLSIKKSKLNHKKLLKWYLYIQGFMLIGKLPGNDKLDWITVFMIPIVIISLLLIYYFFLYHTPNEMDFELSDDFECYKKQFERDLKLKKLIK